LSKVVDARGLLCPEPVLRTKKVIDKMSGGSLEVLVDNPAARENVTRLCTNKGWNVTVSEQGRDIILKISK